MRFLRNLIKKRRHEIESFQARLQMENNAQRNIDARLKALQISVDNEVRRKRSDRG